MATLFRVVARASAAIILFAALAACNKPKPGPPCATPIPSTLLYEIYCDVNNRIFCLSPQYQNI